MSGIVNRKSKHAPLSYPYTASALSTIVVLALTATKINNFKFTSSVFFKIKKTDKCSRNATVHDTVRFTIVPHIPSRYDKVTIYNAMHEVVFNYGQETHTNDLSLDCPLQKCQLRLSS